MKWLVTAVVAVSAVAAGPAGGWAVPAARAAVPADGSLGRAIEVPGLGALNKGGYAQVTSLSCASGGNCAAGGYYADGSGTSRGFVVSERRGAWGRAIEVHVLSSVSAGVDSLSCSSAGNCVAGGYYLDRSYNPQGFVAAERNGVWAKAIEVPGLGALNKDPNNGYGAEVDSVSCTSTGNCSYGGFYQGRHGNQQGFVAAERNGRWGKAIEVPGLGALNKDGYALISSVSCASPGNCAAGGESAGGSGGFVASERNGVWRKAISVPGLAALGGGAVDSVSCTRAGSCAAAGIYFARHRLGSSLGFVAAERNGRWGKATPVSGQGALRPGEVNSVSCASPGNCAAGGFYAGHGAGGGGFVAAERNGRWGKAIPVPGLAALIKGRGSSGVMSVSCASPGNCAASGTYAERTGLLRPFVASQHNGRWGKATPVPGLAALDKGSSQPLSQAAYDPALSCAPAGTCAVGGTYTDASKHAQGYVTQTR